ncbi:MULTISPECIES: gp53-like domain-containing protein [Burkholderia cepacia complex]|uniref:gp53-like domain-containing protein n=1 Tax=Burkholderia cepacia complex TaxID=87882 RepID=UPI000F083BAA|nr:MULTISPECIES: hypothetical protein [Burkholderia cepacia complex]AYQ38344.1 hypothetical protein CVS37_09675 [Burkholderia lata]MDN7895891.1 hypothetical protein [Burkholderia cepacia]
MSVENDFLAFAVGAGANVLSQAAYASMTALGTGFQAGTAQSAALNKVWRQSSIMSAVLAQFIVARTGQPAIDDGTTATLLNNLLASTAPAAGNAGQLFAVATPSNGDSSSNAASTAFVWGELGNYGSFFPFNAVSQQLTASQSGDLIYFFGTNAGVVTLPQGASIHAPSARFVIYNGSLANLTVSAFSGDVWQNWARASEVIGPGDSIEVAWSNGQFFNVVGGTAALKRSSLFAANGSPNGWEKLPSGMIRQWGVVTVTNASETGNTFNFPIAFPNACFVLNGNDNGTPATGGNGGKTIGIGANSNSQFSVNALLNNVWQSGVIVGWQAVGW